MCEKTPGIHLLILITFVSIIGDVVKQFTKRFRDKNLQNNLGVTVDGDNVNKKDGAREIELVSKSDKIKGKDGDEDVNNEAKGVNNSNENEDVDNSSINNNLEMSMNAVIGGMKNIILLVIENMLPHFIFGKIYKRYNGFFLDQEKNFPPLLWIDFLPQEKEGVGIASLNRFITFAVARAALNLVYSIVYPLIYGVEYKPEPIGS